MKIQADVLFTKQVNDVRPNDRAFVNVDADYVEDNEEEVNEWVADELFNMFGFSFNFDEFEVTNMKDILEDLAFDEFQSKTQYANV